MKRKPVYFKIDETLYKEFRKAVIDKYGLDRSSVQKAVEEALALWLKERGGKT